MAEQSRPRRVGGSRNPTGRPRKVAGGPRPSSETPGSPTEDQPGDEVAEAAPAEQPEPEKRSRRPRRGKRERPAEPEREARETEADARTTRDLVGARPTTVVLVAVILVFALAAAGEVVYLVRGDSPTISAARPVVTGELTQRAAVEAAARSTEQILSTSYQDYDDQVEQATRKMTSTFAKEYRQTADGLKEKYAAQQLKLQVKAVAQGVVQASSQQVQALLFLNQYVEKQENGQPATSFAQYRALVTVVRTDHGWLVSDIETQ